MRIRSAESGTIALEKSGGKRKKKKAESGDFPYFSHLKSVLDNCNWSENRAGKESVHDIKMNELSAYNPDSLLFKSLRGDNPDILVMIMEWKEISFFKRF